MFPNLRHPPNTPEINTKLTSGNFKKIQEGQSKKFTEDLKSAKASVSKVSGKEPPEVQAQKKERKKSQVFNFKSQGNKYLMLKSHERILLLPNAIRFGKVHVDRSVLNCVGPGLSPFPEQASSGLMWS